MITQAIAVGRDTFRPDASQLVELLMQLQSKYASLSSQSNLFIEIC